MPRARRVHRPHYRVLLNAGALFLLVLALSSTAAAQDPTPQAPANQVPATFTPAPLLVFPNPTDSNSPLVWIGDQLTLFNSVDGHPDRSTGSQLQTEQSEEDGEPGSGFDDDVGSGRWLEAVIRDDDSGRLYGWYHEEIVSDCPQGPRLWPQIGATLSDDDGVTWQDLGLILTPRDGTVTCDTDHPVTNGGIGDFSVILDNNTAPEDHYAYFIFSSYGGDLDEQGISFARMPWIDRDEPLDRLTGQSQASKWNGSEWSEPGIGGRSEAIFHDAQQISWTREQNNGYWGPSVHWNVDLNSFIVLMNRSGGDNYDPDGIYMTYTTALDSPLTWAQPKIVIEKDQGWYPEVVGDQAIHGTDKLAGSVARYFNMGRSSYTITFQLSTRTTSSTPTGTARTRRGVPTGR